MPQSFLLLLALTGIISAASSEWLEHTSETGRFKVSVPGKLKTVVQQIQTEVGLLEYHNFVLRDETPDADNLFYLVSYCDYPAGSIHSDSVDWVREFLDATVEESVSSVNGQLIYENDIKQDGFPGKLWRVDYGSGAGVIRTKAFVRGRRFYTVQTACEKDKSLNLSADKFMDSFVLLDGEIEE